MFCSLPQVTLFKFYKCQKIPGKSNPVHPLSMDIWTQQTYKN